MMEKIDDLRERLTLQMYDSLVFLGEVARPDQDVAGQLAADPKWIDDLHKWWEKEGHDLTAELNRIRTRLDVERETAKAA
jgi:hypothetical protein